MNIYQKYIPKGQTIHAVIHQHWVVVIDSFILWLSFGALIPSFLYYHSERFQELIPFYFLEILLLVVFLKIIYELFNWYHDVWIVTDEAVYDLDWSLFSTNLESLHYENMEGIEIAKHRIWDSIFNKGDIIIHKFGEEEFTIINAASPYTSVDILETYIHPPKPEPEEDRFDLIMDALGGVVSNYLRENGEKDPNLEEIELRKKGPYFDERYTLDLNTDERKD